MSSAAVVIGALRVKIYRCLDKPWFFCHVFIVILLLRVPVGFFVKQTLPKMGQLLKARICSSGANSFLSELTHFVKGCKNEYARVVALFRMQIACLDL